VPWAITSGTGTVSQQGAVDVTVKGLVIPSIGGINPIANFEATVSCLTPDGVVNVSTGRFDASVPGGNSHITATVDLPRPCKDPIVFVGIFPSGRWFAMSNPTLSLASIRCAMSRASCPAHSFCDRIAASEPIFSYSVGAMRSPAIALWPRSPGGVPSTTFAAPAASVADRTP